jgi:formate dehydrogenase subunit gamma
LSEKDQTVTAVNNALDANAGKKGALLPILHHIQDAIGYVPEGGIERIGKSLGLSRAEVHGVISFYHHFRTAPPGKKVIQVCRSEACKSMGGDDVAEALKTKLGIDFHQTSSDGEYSLEAVYCLGHCACAPALMVNDVPLAKVTPSRVDEVIAMGEI